MRNQCRALVTSFYLTRIREVRLGRGSTLGSGAKNFFAFLDKMDHSTHIFKKVWKIDPF